MELGTILVATDFSECSGAAFQMAKQLGRRFEGKVILLHVINQRVVERLAEHLAADVNGLLPEFREKAQQNLDRFIEEWGPDHAEVESMVSVGLPFQQIAVIARDLQVDLVVLGGYGRSGRGPIEEVFFGSTAEKVVRLLPCPVLCVPLEGLQGKRATGTKV
jgi:nucleotide-binding universal stress UspA family protein